MVRADMLTKSRSFLVSLVAGLMLATGSMGCDVEDSSSSEEAIEADALEAEGTDSHVDHLTHGGRPAHASRLDARVQGDAARVDVVRAEAKMASPRTAANAPSVGLQIGITSEDGANFELDGAEVEQDQTGSRLTFGTTKSGHEPDPWDPNEPEPDPWMPPPDDKDDRR